MKKGQEYTGIVEEVLFPNRGVVCVDGETEKVSIKNVIPGQRVRFVVSKKRKRIEGRLLEVLERSALETAKEPCPHFLECGGCLYQTVPYEAQLSLKEKQIRTLLSPLFDVDSVYRGISGSPVSDSYRNKMELSFGDCEKGGDLTLGMHRRGSFFDVLETTDCRLMDRDMRRVAGITLEYFREKGVAYYHKRTHRGYLRHLLIRKAGKTGEMLVCLVTSSDLAGKGSPEGLQNENMEAEKGSPEGLQSVNIEAEKGLSDSLQNVALEAEKGLLEGWKNALLEAEYEGRVVGILHTRNDRLADVVEDQGTEILFGQGAFREELLGLQFVITPFSFFQTNSAGAEILYDSVKKAISEKILSAKDAHFSRIFDLYSGTGTIAQLLADVADEVVGVEIVSEAVEAAKENASRNGISNCTFIEGDVLSVLSTLEKAPDCIILDPPRDGVHPKALPKILAYQVPNIVYISCKATSLARDLPLFFEAGYEVKDLWMVDLFPSTGNVETVCLLSNRKPDARVKIDVDLEDYYRIKDEQKKNKASE